MSRITPPSRLTRLCCHTVHYTAILSLGFGRLISCSLIKDKIYKNGYTYHFIEVFAHFLAST